MSYKIDELLKLAHRLESAAIVAEAKVIEHNTAKETDLAEMQQNRADSARHYVSVCHFFYGQLKKKEKAAAFIRPTLAEAKAFAAGDPKCSGWPMPDVEKFFNHFEANGWRTGKGGIPMKSWHAAARNWAAGWRERHVCGGDPRGLIGRPPKGPAKKDPERWREFLRDVKMQYVEEWRAQGYLREEFAKWLKK